MHALVFNNYYALSRHIFFTVIWLLAWQSSSFAQSLDVQLPLENQLKNNTSPYLAIHGDDPVAWQEWSPATVALARRQNKLLFVSIGYFSCHWCHVMQAESYRDTDIAALINQNYIPVKVDRELEVALDAEMIAYVQSIHGAAGWPLNVFITPDGNPLYATLYEKPARFNETLTALDQEWKKDSAGLKVLAQKRVKAAKPLKKIVLSAALAVKYRKQLVTETLAQADFMSGGLNLPSKFPIAPQLAALLEIEARQHDAKLSEWLRLTLDQMARGGLRDHVGGGFFRYTVDPDWRTPHFEKMLYDNAQLAMIYQRAAHIFNNPFYRDLAIETLDFMLADMRLGPAFITSTSALDEQGREGGVYLWNEAQLSAIVDQDEYALLRKIWGMETPADFDLGYLPMNRSQPSIVEKSRLKKIYAKLTKIRQLRAIPKDTKLLAGLNGLALAAFSEAAVLAPRYRQAASELRTFMVNELWQNEALSKGMSKQQLLGHGDLEAYAYTVLGLMRYAQLSGDAKDINIAHQITKAAWKNFHTPYGFQLEQASQLAQPFYMAAVDDGPLPSPSSVLIDMSLRTADKQLRLQARNALAEAETSEAKGVFWFASQVSALTRLFDVPPKR